MLGRRHDEPDSSPADSESTTAGDQRTKGISLVKGPVGLIGLLLLGYGVSALMHWGAKGMSLIVGLGLVMAAVIGLAKGHGVLGVFAANHLTELVWGSVGSLLVALSLLPRVGGRATKRSSAARHDQRESTAAPH